MQISFGDSFSGIFLRITHAGCGFFFCCKPQPQLLATKNHKHPLVGNEIDPREKLFSHAEAF